jgi:hypothetical protein
MERCPCRKRAKSCPLAPETFPLTAIRYETLTLPSRRGSQGRGAGRIGGMDWTTVQQIAIWTAALITIALALLVLLADTFQRLSGDMYFILH